MWLGLLFLLGLVAFQGASAAAMHQAASPLTVQPAAAADALVKRIIVKAPDADALERHKLMPQQQQQLLQQPGQGPAFAPPQHLNPTPAPQQQPVAQQPPPQQAPASRGAQQQQPLQEQQPQVQQPATPSPPQQQQEQPSTQQPPSGNSNPAVAPKPETPTPLIIGDRDFAHKHLMPDTITNNTKQQLQPQQGAAAGKKAAKKKTSAKKKHARGKKTDGDSAAHGANPYPGVIRDPELEEQQRYLEQQHPDYHPDAPDVTADGVYGSAPDDAPHYFNHPGEQSESDEERQYGSRPDEQYYEQYYIGDEQHAPHHDGPAYDEDGYDLATGYDELGYDREGFDVDGYDRLGYSRAGLHKDGYSEDGYDIYGFDRLGYDATGRDAAGYDKDGYDEQGFDVDGKRKEQYELHDTPHTEEPSGLHSQDEEYLHEERIMVHEPEHQHAPYGHEHEPEGYDHHPAEPEHNYYAHDNGHHKEHHQHNNGQY